MKTDYSLSQGSRNGRPRKPIEIAMTPMIDVIFLLLVFFLATSSFQLVEMLLPSSVSEMSPPQGNAPVPTEEPSEDAIDQVIVELKDLGGETVVLLNRVPLESLNALRVRLLGIGSTGADVPVIIDPEASIIAADVIQAYDWAREAGLARVYLATRGS